LDVGVIRRPISLLNFGKKKDYKGQAGKDHEDRSNSVPKTKESIGIERVDSKSSF
jgi:hypothetical protein